jgi:hypothetical protein
LRIKNEFSYSSVGKGGRTYDIVADWHSSKGSYRGRTNRGRSRHPARPSVCSYRPLYGDETHIRIRRTKDNGNNPPESPHTPPLEKGGRGDFKEGYRGISR